MKLIANPRITKIGQYINKQPWLGDLLALIGGATMSLGYAPFNHFMAAILCPALLLGLWLISSAKRACWRGFLFGMGLFGVSVSWVYISIHVYGKTAAPIAGILTLLFIAILSGMFCLQGYLLNRLFPNNTVKKVLLAFPALWLLTEWFFSWFLTGFPWLLLGYSQLHSPLRGYAPILGVFGVSLLTCFSAGLWVAFAGIRQRHKQIGILVILCGLWMSGYGLNKIHWTRPAARPQSVSLIQGNIPQEMKWQADQFAHIIELYYQLTRSQWGRDIIVWPEAAIPIPIWYVEDYLAQLNDQAKQHFSSVVLGIPKEAKHSDQYYNTVLALGDGSGIYYKRHLVPFGEYLPLEHLLRGVINFFDIPMSDFIKGNKQQPLLHLNGIPTAAFICYEVAYPALVLNTMPQAQLMLVVSDDSWFGDSLAAPQHLAIGQMRALEMGRPMLFSTNNGITAVINPQGHITATAPRFKRAILQATVEPQQGSTPFMVWGELPVIILVIGMLGWALLAKP